MSWKRKYELLRTKHENLEIKFIESKTKYERKINRLKLQLKHTLIFVGNKIHKIETALKFYKKQYKMNQYSIFKQNKNIQTELYINNNKKSKNTFDNYTQNISNLVNILNDTNNSTTNSPTISNHKNDLIYNDIKTTNNIATNNDDTFKLKIDKELNDDICGDINCDDMDSKNIILRHNVLMEKLKLKLDCMSNDLTQKQNELKNEFGLKDKNPNNTTNKDNTIDNDNSETIENSENCCIKSNTDVYPIETEKENVNEFESILAQIKSQMSNLNQKLESTVIT